MSKEYLFSSWKIGKNGEVIRLKMQKLTDDRWQLGGDSYGGQNGPSSFLHCASNSFSTEDVLTILRSFDSSFEDHSALTLKEAFTFPDFKSKMRLYLQQLMSAYDHKQAFSVIRNEEDAFSPTLNWEKCSTSILAKISRKNPIAFNIFFQDFINKGLIKPIEPSQIYEELLA